MSYRCLLFFWLISFIQGHTSVYQDMYAPLKLNYNFSKFKPSACFLVILVDAPHLNYQNTNTLLKSLAKHPRNACKEGTVGHAWVYLYKREKGQEFILEGGHSGELGICQPRYLEGVMNLVECGDANPIRYLWANQRDGFFQSGPGRHSPSFACAVHLSDHQYQNILKFISTYCFKKYSLRKQQCVTFVMQIAQLAGLSLSGNLQIEIASELYYKGHWIRLWSHPYFSKCRLYTPDALEISMLEAVKSGKADAALTWYKCHSFRKKWFQKCLFIDGFW